MYFEFFHDFKGSTISKPPGKRPSGSAIGQRFEEFGCNRLKERYPGKCFEEYELLNNEHEFTSPTAEYICRYRKGKKKKPGEFVKKQSDTADRMFLEKVTKGRNVYHFLDFKGDRYKAKDQPGNTISSYKLYKIAQSLLKHRDWDEVDIVYVCFFYDDSGIPYEVMGSQVVSVFNIAPADLKINLTAGLQCQVNFKKFRTFDGTRAEWCLEFINEYGRKYKKQSIKFDKESKKAAAIYAHYAATIYTPEIITI